MKINAVIFDMDGVIFDSETVVIECWKKVAEGHGISGIEIPCIKAIGTNTDATRVIFKEFYGSGFPFDEYNREKSGLYHSLYDNGRLPMKPGVHALLAYLKDSGRRIAVASSTRTQVVRNQLEAAGLLPYFDCIVGGDMVSRSKPFPDIFLKAADGTGFPVQETVVIEDSYNGIRAASAAGMIPIMVPDMLPPTEEMQQTAAYIFKSLEEVQQLLENNK